MMFWKRSKGALRETREQRPCRRQRREGSINFVVIGLHMEGVFGFSAKNALT